MAERDSDPLQQVCRGLQTHWSEVARNAGALQTFCGGQVQRVLISSGMVHQHSGPNPAHFHRRKPAFASVSVDAPVKSSKKHKKDKKEKKGSKDREESKDGKDGKDSMDKDRDIAGEPLSRKQAKLLKKLEKMSPEEQAAYREAAIMARKVAYKGRKVTLGQLAKEVEEEEAQQSGGAVDFSGKNRSNLEKVPGYKLRPGAPKMQLRPEEEELLPLDLLGSGALWSKRPVFGYLMGGCRDAGFGVYAKCGILRKLLKRRWAGHDPDEVLEDEHFYNDLIKYGAKTELTLMAVPSRNISLPTLRKHVEQRMLRNLDTLAKAQKGPEASVHPDDEGALKRLCDLYLDTLSTQSTLLEAAPLPSAHAGNALSQTGFVKGDQILAGTNFIFSTTRHGAFTAEAVLPFQELKDRKSVYLLRNKYPNLTYAFWGMVLGPQAVSVDAKVNVGQGALYITNGFKFGPNPGNPHQVLITDPDNEPESLFPAPPNAQDIKKQLPGGSIIDACRFAKSPDEVLKVVSSKRLAKHEKTLRTSRKAAEHQRKKGQKKTGRKAEHSKGGE